MIELECPNLVFYSAQDEASFFSWGKAISSVSNIIGRGWSIIIQVKTKRISEESLRELIALFYRYNISMSQLAQFRTAQNEHWFASPESYWYKSVFNDY